jgi:predicted nucleotidyltransferase
LFSPEERDRLREQIVAAARADKRITGAAMTGSSALGNQDKWSDIDLFFGVRDEEDLAGAMAAMTELMYREHGALHHFDVVAGPATYRVFLMRSTLQVDLAFTPASSFGAVAPSFMVLFGQPVERTPIAPATAMSLLDYGWLYALHARSSIERGKVWQAEYMISLIRDQVIAASCVRHGLPAREGRGVDRLPQNEKQRFEVALVRSLEPAELRRAMRAAIDCLVDEVSHVDARLAARIEPALKELAR